MKPILVAAFLVLAVAGLAAAPEADDQLALHLAVGGEMNPIEHIVMGGVMLLVTNGDAFLNTLYPMTIWASLNDVVDLSYSIGFLYGTGISPAYVTSKIALDVFPLQKRLAHDKLLIAIGLGDTLVTKSFDLVHDGFKDEVYLAAKLGVSKLMLVYKMGYGIPSTSTDFNVLNVVARLNVYFRIL